MDPQGPDPLKGRRRLPTAQIAEGPCCIPHHRGFLRPCFARIFQDQAHASFHIFQSKHLSKYSHHWVKACRAQGPKAMSQLAAAASTLQHKISKVGRVPSNVPQRLNAMCLHQARRCMTFHLILGRYPNSLFSDIVIGRLQQQALHNQSQSYRLSFCHNIFFVQPLWLENVAACLAGIPSLGKGISNQEPASFAVFGCPPFLILPAPVTPEAPAGPILATSCQGFENAKKRTRGLSRESNVNRANSKIFPKHRSELSDCETATSATLYPQGWCGLGRWRWRQPKLRIVTRPSHVRRALPG